MRFDILTLFPEMFDGLKASLIGKAINKKILTINIINIRDYSLDKHKKCDDYTFGGGLGMLMTPGPIYNAITSIGGYEKAYKIYLSPKGNILNQKKVKALSNMEHIILLCGHYEGVDQRIIDMLIDEEISIGDFVLTGGEIPAMAIVDSVSRYLPGVLGKSESANDESFSNGLLEYPQYTRPAEFMGLKVPEVLLSGNHAEIAKWREGQAKIITEKRRPDLISKNNHKN